MKSALLAAALSALMLAGSPVLAQSTDQTAPSSLVQSAVADTLRPADEVARDPLRHPAEILAFAQVQPGQRVADIRPGAGYFTLLFARVVGEGGHVYAFVPNKTAERENPRADALVAAYPNVSRVNGDLDAMAFDQPLDVVFMSQEYHDFHIPRFGVDVAKMNADIFKALKPGGLFVVIDHQAAPGAGNTAVETLHRIEGAQLRKEVEAAGFIFDGETAAVANPADDHSLNVFDEAIRGKTDQFVYRFKKPG
ncbi:class I SAM-dependent methyltransferase [Brevundimonas sp. P7753]|uniref:class I SAM-dependent methyltransferase n=1 Tax=Brevundimonas sp. P7753 TaxID=2726982 RepID=UPI0021067B71|nr:methyltransferase domain-containing protein [Brevundimonas sp. P7753]